MLESLIMTVHTSSENNPLFIVVQLLPLSQDENKPVLVPAKIQESLTDNVLIATEDGKPLFTVFHVNPLSE